MFNSYQKMILMMLVIDDTDQQQSTQNSIFFAQMDNAGTKFATSGTLVLH